MIRYKHDMTRNCVIFVKQEHDLLKKRYDKHTRLQFLGINKHVIIQMETIIFQARHNTTKFLFCLNFVSKFGHKHNTHDFVLRILDTNTTSQINFVPILFHIIFKIVIFKCECLAGYCTRTWLLGSSLSNYTDNCSKLFLSFAAFCDNNYTHLFHTKLISL